MISQTVKITNLTGLHLRPAGKLCGKAMEFEGCTITFKYRTHQMTGTSVANAKSVLSILGAGVKCGDEIELICDGEQEELVLRSMVEFVNSGIGD